MTCCTRSANKSDINDILKFYYQLSLEEGIYQFKHISKAEMEKYLRIYMLSFKNKFIRRLQDKGDNIFLFAMNNRKNIGYIHARRKGKYWHVESVYVTKDQRRKGIAEMLYKELEGKIRAHNGKKVLSEVYFKNYPSRKLHSNLGFAPYSVTYYKAL